MNKENKDKIVIEDTRKKLDNFKKKTMPKASNKKKDNLLIIGSLKGLQQT